MSLSPLAYADSLRVGVTDFVSPDEIKVVIDIETPDGVALNTGTPRPFPRINSYVLIPNDQGFLVGQVEWITVERSQYPKRKGMQDFGLVDLPYPLRKMSLNPVGTLASDTKSGANDAYTFRRGVEGYPTVGDPVILPTDIQLRAIIESGEHRYVKIGTSPLAANAEVRVNPDRLFGRHLAVLGNTGSGKSCSVAGLIRWSMNEAKRAAMGKDPNARFIVLDPNGEYANTFSDMSKVRVFAVEPKGGISRLQVPMWFWNTSEWSAFVQASAKTQRPTLIQALRTVRDADVDSALTPSHDMRRFLRTVVGAITAEKNAGRPWLSFPHPKNFTQKLVAWREGIEENASFTAAENQSIKSVTEIIDGLLDPRTPTTGNRYPTYDFTKTEIDELLSSVHEAHHAFGGSDQDVLPIDADVPRSFTGDQFLRSVEANAELMNVSEHVETMLMRIRTILSDSRMKTITGGEDGISLESWLKTYIGDDQASNGSVTVIDLSLVPPEVVHIITAVVARMTLEALQRYRKLAQGKTLPTVLVMEEAHTFIKRYKDEAENQNAAVICCQVFERIAREGRKFGLGLVLSSQRPSELSPTVLSQCNTYLLHRISNDQDQELVRRLLPDNLRGLLRDLPSLPSRHALFLGWASELPVLVKMNALPENQRPKSDDPDFWEVWTKQKDRTVDWESIANDWQQISMVEKDDAPAPATKVLTKKKKP